MATKYLGPSAGKAAAISQQHGHSLGRFIYTDESGKRVHVNSAAHKASSQCRNCEMIVRLEADRPTSGDAYTMDCPLPTPYISVIKHKAEMVAACQGELSRDARLMYKAKITADQVKSLEDIATAVKSSESITAELKIKHALAIKEALALTAELKIRERKIVADMKIRTRKVTVVWNQIKDWPQDDIDHLYRVMQQGLKDRTDE